MVLSPSQAVLAWRSHLATHASRRLRRPALAHLSYRPKRLPTQRLCTRGGGADRVRTDDPLLAKQVLSQLSYSPSGRDSGPTTIVARPALRLADCRCLVWAPWSGSPRL